MVGHHSPACVYQISWQYFYSYMTVSPSSRCFPTCTHHQFTTQPTVVSEETQELLSRVAGLQQEKWELEERVGWELVRFAPIIAGGTRIYTTYVSLWQINHLENTGSALAEDVLQKSEIIKSYFMETKAGTWSQMSVNAWVLNCICPRGDGKLVNYTTNCYM